MRVLTQIYGRAHATEIVDAEYVPNTGLYFTSADNARNILLDVGRDAAETIIRALFKDGTYDCTFFDAEYAPDAERK